MEGRRSSRAEKSPSEATGDLGGRCSSSHAVSQSGSHLLSQVFSLFPSQQLEVALGYGGSIFLFVLALGQRPPVCVHSKPGFVTQRAGLALNAGLQYSSQPCFSKS